MRCVAEKTGSYLLTFQIVEAKREVEEEETSSEGD